MTRLRKGVLWLSAILGVVLPVLFAALWGLSRAMTPTRQQREALAMLEAPIAVSGRNAFARLWLLEYDTPEAELDDVVRADAQRLRELLDANPHDLAPQLPSDSTALGHYPHIAKDDGSVSYCGLREGDCLQHVRDHREAIAARLHREAALLRRVRSLADYGHYRYELPRTFDAPLPPFRGLAISHTQSALDFAEGRTASALESVCRDVATWRRLANHGDSLVFNMIGLSLQDADARLFAQMLAELPLDQALPDACANAFDPERDTPDMCLALQGEAAQSFDLYERMSRVPNRWSERVIYALGFSASRAKARLAVAYARVCTDTVRTQIATDLPIVPAPAQEAGVLDRLGCIGNSMGCVMADTAAPAYDKYLLRAQDGQAVLRVVAMLLWLRDHAPDRAMSPEWVRRMLAEHWVQPRAIALDEAAMSLQIGFRDTSKVERWQVPLPASRLLPSAAAHVSPRMPTRN